MDAFTNGYDFWFVDAEKIKNSTGPLPKHQDLRRQDGLDSQNGSTASTVPKWLHRKRIGLSECMHFVLTYCLTVSYIWGDKDHPDKDGTQADALRKWLRTNSDILFVWIDFCSLPQMPRCGAEVKEFSNGLRFVNLVYLSCKVLKIINSQYLARFWPQFEAWLSYQAISRDASVFEPNLQRSFSTFTGFAEDDPEEAEHQNAMVERRWSTATISQVKTRLGRKEVAVTNEGDKDIQFEKIDQLAKLLGMAVAAGGSSGGPYP